MFKISYFETLTFNLLQQFMCVSGLLFGKVLMLLLARCVMWSVPSKSKWCWNILPYCRLWPRPLYKYFSTLSHKRQDFSKKKLLKTKRVLISSTACVWSISYSKKELSELWYKMDVGLHMMCLSVCLSVCYSCPILVKLERSRHFVKKYPSIKFNENPLSGTSVLRWGRTRRR